MTEEFLSEKFLCEAVARVGYELVDFRVSGQANRQLVRLRIDFPGGSEAGAGVTTQDCAKVSRALEQELEQAGAVGPRYTMEVSSPGVERPIRFIDHWRRYAGREVSLKAKGLEGRSTATIGGVTEAGQLQLIVAGQEVSLPLDAVKEATLVVDWSAYG